MHRQFSAGGKTSERGTASPRPPSGPMEEEEEEEEEEERYGGMSSRDAPPDTTRKYDCPRSGGLRTY